MKRRIVKLSALFFLGFSLLSAEETDIEIPDREILEKISNNPGIIKALVSQEKGDDKIRWIEMYTDVHIVSAIPMDKLRRAVLDFDTYPRIFRRNEKTVVIRENETLYLDMDVGAEFLGIDFFVNYRVRVTETRNTPEEFILDFSYVSSDSSVQDVSGRWQLKKLPQAEGVEQQFYVRYYAYSKVASKYPLQRMIMSLFINSESRDLMNQFVKAAGML
ncbi:MAG: hypothetical protein LBK63_12610 [Treponema sp.]|jgi:hypothetical protein|nr:hypothetical protein [Treponema sp.]